MPSSSFCFYCTLTLLTLWFSFTQPLCHDRERSSLLQIKQSFVINQSASDDPRAYSKVDSWKHERDCCLWDGVECKEGSGLVISLDLSSSFLYGSVNSTSSLFNLVHLEMLNLADNHFNESQIPSAINQLSKLTYLNLSFSVFSGQIPSEISDLSNLSFLDLSSTVTTTGRSLLELKSPVFTSLIQNMTRLKVLHLKYVNIQGELPASIGDLSSLIDLEVPGSNLSGLFPFSIGKLNQLKYLSLCENNFWGPIPSFLGNLTQLTHLELCANLFSGPIPPSFSKLKNLETLDVEDNEFSGTLNFDMFLSLKNLTTLGLSDNKLSLLIKRSANETLPQYTALALSFCNLSSFPDFLKYQTRLEELHLQGNHIGGLLPQWLMNISRGTLFTLNLAQNFLTGELSPEICNFKSLGILNLFENKLFGKLPPCLKNLTSSLVVLKLYTNSFSGSIPEFAEGCQLSMIDFHDNRLQGKLPQSLKNCKELGYLHLGNNQLNDVFPYWLGTLPELKILVLRSNGFNGVIGEPQTSLDFPQLRIIDISENNFTGKLPSKYLQNWKAMKHSSVEHLSYMKTKLIANSIRYLFYVTITIKGVKRDYEVINEDLAIINLSNNCFDKEIPEVIGSLKNLYSLDLSSNNLTGGIPSSLANLNELESLDLSQNMLSGEIPRELTKLNFLQYFNFSHNRLTGQIPQGNHLDTFEATSYEGNLGLCGIPLPKCENSNASDTSFNSGASEDKQEDSGSPFGFGWKVVVIGYACGFVVGLFIGQVVIARRPRWFATIFLVSNEQARRKGRIRREN